MRVKYQANKAISRGIHRWVKPHLRQIQLRRQSNIGHSFEQINDQDEPTQLATSISEATPMQSGQSLESEDLIEKAPEKKVQHQVDVQMVEEERELARQVKQLLRQLRHGGTWTVRVELKEEVAFQQEAEVSLRDSRAQLEANGGSHGTLISKGW